MNRPSFPHLADSDRQLPLYLTSVGHWPAQERTMRTFGFPHYQWLQCDGGTGQLRVGNVRQPVKPGQGFLLYPNEYHLYEPVSGPWSVRWVSFNGRLASSLLEQAGLAKSCVYAVANPDTLIRHHGELYGGSLVSHPFAGMDSSKRLYAFLLDLMKGVSAKSATAEQHYSKLHPVLQYIADDCSRPVSIAELAGLIDVSPQYLCHLFKKALKMRPMEYVARERMNKAKEWMLTEPKTTAREIASRVGYDNASYFGAVFKRATGFSPEAFKRSNSPVN